VSLTIFRLQTKLPLLAINFDTMGRAEEKSGDA